MKQIYRLLVAAAFVLLGTVSAAAQTNDTVKHVVDRGETLASIAKRYSVTEAKIIELNPDAAQFVYVGMELVIPVVVVKEKRENTSAASVVSNGAATLNNTATDVKTVNQSASLTYGERMAGFIEVGYSASSFEDVKMSGSYGIGITFLPWELTDRFYWGLNMLSMYINNGLVDSDLATLNFKVGPALGYYFNEKTIVSMPVDVVCSLWNVPNSTKTKLYWGMQFSPSVYLGLSKKFGIYLGPQLTIGFSKGSEATFGFNAGLYFSTLRL